MPPKPSSIPLHIRRQRLNRPNTKPKRQSQTRDGAEVQLRAEEKLKRLKTEPKRVSQTRDGAKLQLRAEERLNRLKTGPKRRSQTRDGTEVPLRAEDALLHASKPGRPSQAATKVTSSPQVAVRNTLERPKPLLPPVSSYRKAKLPLSSPKAPVSRTPAARVWPYLLPRNRSFAYVPSPDGEDVSGPVEEPRYSFWQKLNPWQWMKSWLHPSRERRLAPGHLQHSQAPKPIVQLREWLGLQSGSSVAREVVFFSLDCEFHRRSMVTEIGLSILPLWKVEGLKPGHLAENWIGQLENHHFVLLGTRNGLLRPKPALFTNSFRTDPVRAKQAVCELLQSHRKQSEERSGKPPVIVLVGHSVKSDVDVLRLDPRMRFNIYDPAYAGGFISTTCDTTSLVDLARNHGIGLPANLGGLCRVLGVHPYLYGKSPNRPIKGWHNASNDAAYTMMALFQFAIRWPQMSRAAQKAKLAARRNPISARLGIAK